MRREGGWVLLQNCHLAKSWMAELQKVIECIDSSRVHTNVISSNYEGLNAGNKDVLINPNFRLFLTSLPADFFPSSILQKTLKFALEKPTGLL